MPTYQFQDSNTGELIEKVMKISELDQFKADNPHLTRVFEGSSASIGDPVRLGIRKNDNGWREVLHKIAERTPGAKGLRDSIR